MKHTVPLAVSARMALAALTLLTAALSQGYPARQTVDTCRAPQNERVFKRHYEMTLDNQA